MPRRRRHVLPGADRALDDLKYEVAGDLGLENDIQQRGWGDMTTREVGKVGGNMVRRMIERAERDMADEEFGTEWAGYPEITGGQSAVRSRSVKRSNDERRRHERR